MEKIKKLLAEYEIRFHDTEEIKTTENIPFSRVNSGTFEPKVASNIIWNKNGIAYKDGKWATAKITKKPERWVVERNEDHPVWLRFKEMTQWTDSDRGTYLYYSDGICSTTLLDFEGYQYLTLDQWAEFYLPKVDFSIHNDYEFFFVKTCHYRSWLSRGKLTEGNCTSFCLNNNRLDTIGHLVSSKDEIIEFRRPTEEEFNILYQYHPKYEPPKEGDWGIFWNKWPGATKVDSFVNMTSEGKYLDSFDYSWENFKPFQPEIQEAINNEFDEIN
jgi:hypothetical protein